MTVDEKRRRAESKLKELLARPKPRGVGQVFARAESGRLMTIDERLRFFDDIRSRSKPTTEDSTDIIRRDRDER